MIEICGIKLLGSTKIYYFSPKGLRLSVGDRVVVETAKGKSCGTVAVANRMLQKTAVVGELKPVLRTMTPEDEKRLQANAQKETRAFTFCNQKIEERHLKMKLVEVQCAFDNSKLLFFFTADNRVDFRDLVKDLAGVFHMRIELRQIGVRDEAKMFGGLGVCGREFCCRTHLGSFQPVSIRMAKDQGLSLNPTKISGTCGRLMCCLKNEQPVYEEMLRITPKIGAIVKTPQGKGRVEDANVLTGKLKIKPDKDSDMPYVIDRDEVTIIKDGKTQVTKEEKALRKLES